MWIVTSSRGFAVVLSVVMTSFMPAGRCSAALPTRHFAGQRLAQANKNCKAEMGALVRQERLFGVPCSFTPIAMTARSDSITNEKPSQLVDPALTYLLAVGLTRTSGFAVLPDVTCNVPPGIHVSWSGTSTSKPMSSSGGTSTLKLEGPRC